MHYGLTGVNAQLPSKVTNLMKAGHTGRRRYDATLIPLEVDSPNPAGRIIWSGCEAKNGCQGQN
jgi:hypothetical protein